MKNLKNLILLLPTLLFFNFSLAEVQKTRIETMPIVDLGIIADTGGDLLAVTQYPNGCVEKWSRTKEIKNNVLVLVHFAKIYTNKVCTRAVEYRSVEFDTDHLEGTYKVVDGHDGTMLGHLEAHEGRSMFLSITK